MTYILKPLVLLLFITFSCESAAVTDSNLETKNKEMQQQDGFKMMVSKNATYTLHYKTKEEKNSPVKVFTYYITSNKTKKMVRNSETIAAEKIYWKDDHTIAVIPYVEVMQQPTDNDNQYPNEILIDLNK